MLRFVLANIGTESIVHWSDICECGRFLDLQLVEMKAETKTQVAAVKKKAKDKFAELRLEISRLEEVY